MIYKIKSITHNRLKMWKKGNITYITVNNQHNKVITVKKEEESDII